VQFPWRLLFLTTLFSAALAAFVVETLPKKLGVWAATLVVLAGVALTWGYFRPSQIFYKPDDVYLSRMFATASEEGERKGPTQDYINWSEDYLLLPPGVIKADRPFFAKAVGDDNVKVLDFEKISSTRFDIEVEASIPGKLSLYSLYFPGWYSTVDGLKTQINPGTPYGQMEVYVPSGRHSVEFYWAETPLRKAADYISLVSLGVALLLFTRGEKQKDAAA
jgi:hypothetical protein